MKTFQKLASTLVRFGSVYAAGRERCPALAPYAAARGVVAAVRREPPLPYAERGAIVQALVAEHRASRHELWQTLLLLCFQPMLERRRAKLGAKGSEDLDQLVLLSFLQAVKAYPLHADPAFAAHALRLGTEDALRVNARAMGKRLDTVPFDESLHGYGVFAWLRPGRATDVVNRMLEQGGEEAEALRVVIDTSIGGLTLREIVDETFAGLPPAHRDRAYLRMSRARQKVLDELRARLGELDRAA